MLSVEKQDTRLQPGIRARTELIAVRPSSTILATISCALDAARIPLAAWSGLQLHASPTPSKRICFRASSCGCTGGVPELYESLLTVLDIGSHGPCVRRGRRPRRGYLEDGTGCMIQDGYVKSLVVGLRWHVGHTPVYRLCARGFGRPPVLWRAGSRSEPAQLSWEGEECRAAAGNARVK